MWKTSEQVNRKHIHFKREGVKVSTQQLFWVTNVPSSGKSNRLEM